VISSSPRDHSQFCRRAAPAGRACRRISIRPASARARPAWPDRAPAVREEERIRLAAALRLLLRRVGGDQLLEAGCRGLMLPSVQPIRRCAISLPSRPAMAPARA
jgi:hypothetical protein